MNDSCRVRSRQPGGDLVCVGNDVRYRERSLLDPLFQRLATAIGHGNERTTFPFADLVDGFDVRVIEGACCLSFTNETLLGMRIRSGAFVEEFECHLPVESEILGEVDGPHAARPERFENAVVRDGRSQHEECAGFYLPRSGCSTL